MVTDFYFPSDIVVAWGEILKDILKSLLENIKPIKEHNLEKSPKIITNQHNDTTTFHKDSITKKASSEEDNIFHELSEEVRNIILIVERDFFLSWYKLVSPDETVLHEMQTLLQHVVHSVQGRLFKLNYLKLFRIALLLYKDHVHNIYISQVRHNTSTKLVDPVFEIVEECYSSKSELHPATKTIEAEQAYQRSVIHVLLVQLLREDLHSAKSLVCALKEILMCNVLQNVISLLSDPTFLHKLIIRITNENVHQGCVPSIHVTETNSSQEHPVPNASRTLGNVQLNQAASSEQPLDVKWFDDIKLQLITSGMCIECNRLCSKDKGRISPRPHSCSLGTTELCDRNSEFDRLSVNSLSSNFSKDSETISASGIEDNLSDKELESVTKDISTLTQAEDETFLVQPQSIDFKSPFDWKISIPKIFSTRKTSSSEVSDIEKRRNSSLQDVPSDENVSSWVNEHTAFTDIQITSTLTMKESGGMGGVYTLYTVEYEALYQPDGNSKQIQKTGTVRRRFREFVNLQSRLEDNPKYKKSMKDVKGPKRILPSLPFGNMGRDTVEGRKELLGIFLKSIITKADISNGCELKEFLGFSGEGHLAYVRRASTGPRIDQRLVRTMSGMLDKIVETLPTLPQQLPRIIPSFDQVEEKADNIDVNLHDDSDDIGLIFNADNAPTQEALEVSLLDGFISHKCNAIDNSEGDSTGSSCNERQLQRVISTCSGQSASSKSSDVITQMEGTMLQSQSPLDDSKCPLSSAIIDIVVELLRGQDHWFGKENTIHVIKVLLGKCLNRIIQSKIEALVSTDMITFYLQTLRETIWPDGNLLDEPIIQHTELEKANIKKEATKCLGDFLSGVLRPVLGSEEFDQAVGRIIESLQYEKINRHLWYTVLDILLEELFPDVNTEEIQRKLSTTADNS